jgi:hypothetical protein
VLTFSLGTNYPYYVVEDREPVERVPGNPYGQFFAGPGIVLTGCDHAVAIWNGLAFRRVPDPGLAFTHQFESIQACIDLRPQLRSFDVVARTRDGIAIKVRTFVPFQIEGGDRVPELGSSFAFFRSSVFRAVHGRRVELGRVGAGNDEIEARQPRAWDDLVVTYACRILHNIISGIAFDELCEPIEASPHASASAGRPLDPDRGPRAEIAQALRSQLQEAVAPSGIRLLGGGISNLLPVEEAPMRGRVDNWLVEWTRLMIARLGEGEAKALETMEKARIEASAELVRRVGKKLEVIGGSSGRVSDAAVAIRFIEAVEEMASNPLVGRALSEGTRETLRLVAAAVGEDRGMGEAQGVGQP